MLLLGFLGCKDAFGIDEVNEVVNELSDESAAPAAKPAPSRAHWDDSGIPSLESSGSLDIDLGKLQITPGLAQAISGQVNSLSVEQYDGRLRRLEHSVLRVERINLEILVMLQKLVAAVAKPHQETES